MGDEAKLVDQVGMEGGPGFVLGAIEVSSDNQAGLSLGGAKEVEWTLKDTPEQPQAVAHAAA